MCGAAGGRQGHGYTEYAGGFLLPAAYACASVGDYDLVNVARTRPWWKLAMYTHSFQPHSRKFIMSGVGHSSNYDEGWASLQLTLVPGDQLPYFLWWYDRHMGRLAPGRSDEKFDCHRAGTIWSMLYYPEHIVARDPTGTYPISAGDSRALLTTFDAIKSNTQHSYTWQANLGSEFDDDDIGEGLDSKFTVGGVTISYNRQDESLIAEE